MLVKYYLSDNIKATFENFALGLRNAWPDPEYVNYYPINPFSQREREREREICLVCIFKLKNIPPPCGRTPKVE